MKKVIIIAGIFSMIFGACSTGRQVTYNDDVYASPTEERRERERIAAEKKKQEEAEARKLEEERAAQKAKDDANPLYQTPSYNKDDYYDYEYASRIRRFNNPVNGLGYYDNYYTNYYWYNNNPAFYGTSIYNSYNWWGPSCGSGLSLGFSYGNPYGGFGYSPYSPYGYGGYGYGYNPYGSYWNGYNQGYYSGLYGYPYGSYGYGYPYYGGGYGYPYGGYGSPYGGGWGYYNSYDVNSGYGKTTYAPRASHDGGNGLRTSHPGMKVNEDAYVSKYIQNVQSAQENTPKFDPSLRNASVRHNNTGYIPVSGTNVDGGSVSPHTYPAGGGNGNNGYTPRNTQINQGTETNPNYGGNPGRPVNIGRSKSTYEESQPANNQPSIVKPNYNNGNNNNSGNQPRWNTQEETKPNWNSNPSYNQPTYQSPSGGGSMPRGGGSGGGGGRPR